MVGGDLMDAIDKSLRLNTGAEKLPFGGVKLFLWVIIFGSPVVSRNEEVELLEKRGYSSPFFFSAHCLDQLEWEYVQLEKVYDKLMKEFVSF